MTWVLVVVTVASLATAGALLAYVVRLARDERDRSDARVAALSELLERPDPIADVPPVRKWPAETAVHQDPFEAVSTLSDRSMVAADEPFSTIETRTELFGGDDDPRPAHRLLIPAAGCLIVGLAITIIYAMNRPASAGASVPASLELISMRHEREGDTLTVSGLVRNPTSGPSLEDVTAVVLTFDRAGTFVTSGRSPLDFRQLGPGDESPFLVRLPGARSVGRYRVTFRSGQRVVPHVDRRDAPPDAVADDRAGGRMAGNHD
jgi:hypothetical protein